VVAGHQIEPGLVLGERYRLVKQAGVGGTGAVYSATRIPEGTRVAVKILRRALADDTVSVTRFERELEALRRLGHPNVVPLLDKGWFGPQPYIVMPWLEGPTLWVRLRRHGPMEVDEVRQIMLPLCSALAAVHRAGMLHRDIKSANVILTADGGPQLLDLGLVHEDEVTALTAPGHACGTPEYMAPERIRGEPEPDHRSDLYSLGILTYEMLTAKLPFTAPKRLDILRAQVRKPPPDPRKIVPMITQDVADAVMRFMHKDPAARPMTALAMARDLDAAAAGSGEWAALGEHLRRPVQGRVVVLGAEESKWEEIPALFEVYQADALRADAPESARALLNASPRAVLWCAAPIAPDRLLEVLHASRATPAAVVVAEADVAEFLVKQGLEAHYCPPGMPVIHFMRTARAMFGSATR
jgi:hypothetical protein